MTQIKICGLARYEDACLASSLGANYLGMVFYEMSKRRCLLDEAHKIITNLYQQKIIFVFGHDSYEYILNILSHFLCEKWMIQVPFDHKSLIQLTKVITPLKIMLSIPIQSDVNDSKLLPFKKYHALILDTGGQKDELGQLMLGGTGVSFDWRYIENLKIKYFLAGGLSDQNIENALGKLNPYGVDVSSGLEKKPGVKNQQKLITFIKKVRQYKRD